MNSGEGSLPEAVQAIILSYIKICTYCEETIVYEQDREFCQECGSCSVCSEYVGDEFCIGTEDNDYNHYCIICIRYMNAIVI